MALPMKLRERVLKACDEGASHKSAAERFMVWGYEPSSGGSPAASGPDRSHR